MEAMHLSDKGIVCVHLGALPDYLLDHTFLNAGHEERLAEHFQRWNQFVQRLWAWKDEAVFCVRLCSSPGGSRVGIYLLGRPRDVSRSGALQEDLQYALRVYGVVLSEEGCGRWEDRFTREALEALPADVPVWGVTQYVTKDIWENETARSQLERGHLRRLWAEGECQLWLPILFPGAAGSFVWLFRALSGVRTAVRVSIYLTPVGEVNAELAWLDALATTARENSKDGDRLVETAAMLAETALHRVSTSRFAIALDCAPLELQGAAAAERITRSLEAYCLEAFQAQAGDERHPVPTAAFAIQGEGEILREAHRAHREIEHPYWIVTPGVPRGLRRLQHLADARGAATLFRLPISTGGGVAGVAVKQAAPDFNPGPVGEDESERDEQRPNEAPVSGGRDKTAASDSGRASGERLVLGTYFSGGQATMKIDDLTKHVLITGMTGGGKTQTIQYLLDQVWRKYNIPFLVIEPAKTEYRSFLKVPGIAGTRVLLPDDREVPAPLIYTLGNEAGVPFRLNPFQVLPGISVESHIGRLQTCFEAAMGAVGPLYSIMEEALILIYRDLGWQLTDVGPNHPDRFPTMSLFATKLEQVAEARGYKGEVGANIKAAIGGRIKPLTMKIGSSKGYLLDTDHSWPPAEVLFEVPAILELNDLNEQNRSLVGMLLLVLLREYREMTANREPQSLRKKKLRHLTVVEEAHAVIGKSEPKPQDESGSPDSGYQAVQAFSNMLAEVRALGEGLIIADQSPNKLSPDALRNTNLHIVHHLRSGEDRRTMADAMGMTPEQEAYIGRLVPGSAAVFFAGLHRATFVRFPEYSAPGSPGEASLQPIRMTEIREHMEPMLQKILRKSIPPLSLCRHCGHLQTCDFRSDSRRRLAPGQELPKKMLEAIKIGSSAGREISYGEIAKLIVEQASIGEMDVDFAWCLLIHFATFKRLTFLTLYPSTEERKDFEGLVKSDFDRHIKRLFV